jgi:hypothetical protein
MTAKIYQFRKKVDSFSGMDDMLERLNAQFEKLCDGRSEFENAAADKQFKEIMAEYYSKYLHEEMPDPLAS